MAVMPLLLMAQGWPANYGGVMLQSFEWDGYTATKWSALTANADELSQCFDLIWVPQSGFIPGNPASTPAKSMGYNDVYWLKQDSYFGTETELRNMISTFKSKGTGIIADVVINHKNGATNWTDFPNESKNGYSLTWNPTANICCTDECNRSGYPTTGANDTGDDFDGCRDLDHTNSQVQQNIITYQKFLLNDLGYAGIRLDMVKGYGGQYTKIYNQATNPTFSVGEYWDGDYNAVMNWVNATGKTSAAFDFPLKYIINEAVGNGNYGALSNKGIAGDPNNSRYAVTFIDNHDTGRDGNAIAKDWSAANAVILAMPGTPCIWVKHFNADKTSIKAMIFARRAAGVHNQSTIVQQEYSNNGYIIRTKGTNGEVCVQLGGAANNGTPSGMKLVAQGDNYKFFCTSSLDITTPHKPGSITPTPTPTPDPTPSNVTVYFKNTQGWSSVNCYAYTDNDNNNGEWPGAAMTYDADITVNGSKGWWKYTLPTGLENASVIFNGDGNQYPAAMEPGLAVGGSSMACDGTDWSAATVGGGDDPTPQPGKEITIYCESAQAPFIWAWDGDGNNLVSGEWPGEQLSATKVVGGRTFYYKTFTASSVNCIFSYTGDADKSADLGPFTSDQYFTFSAGNATNITSEIGGDTPTPGPTPSEVTVYFKNTQGWSSVNCYAYIDGSNNGEWPGAAMTYDADITVNGSKGWWKYTLPTGLENASVIFNGDGNQYPAAMEPGLAVGGSSMACDGTDWSAATVGGGDDPTPQPGKEITIYCESAQAPFIWAWDGDGNNLVSGEWPGEQLSATKVVGGRTFYYKTFTASSVNCIFSYTGDADKSADLGPFTSDQYFTFSAGNATNITSEIGGDTPTPDPQPSGKTTVYVKASSAPHLYAWYMDGETAVELNGAWPGAQMTQKEGEYWVASFDKAPISIIFNDGTAEDGVVGVNQTENIEDISGDNYFTYDGAGSYTKEGSTSIDSVPTVEFQTNNIYTIDGRRIRQNATSLQDLKPGVYIVGGKKIVKY